jgi:hypothetical protein
MGQVTTVVGLKFGDAECVGLRGVRDRRRGWRDRRAKHLSDPFNRP